MASRITDAQLQLTLKKVNRAALVCTIVFGIRFLVWVYGSLVFSLDVIPKTDVIYDIDQFLYPTFHYTFPEIVSDTALLLVLSPNEAEYVSRIQRRNTEDEDDDPPLTNLLVQVSRENKSSSYASVNTISRVDQDDEERRRSRPKATNHGRSSRAISLDDSQVEDYPRDASTLLGESTFYRDSESGSDYNDQQQSDSRDRDRDPYRDVDTPRQNNKKQRTDSLNQPLLSRG